MVLVERSPFELIQPIVRAEFALTDARTIASRSIRSHDKAVPDGGLNILVMASYLLSVNAKQSTLLGQLFSRRLVEPG